MDVTLRCLRSNKMLAILTIVRNWTMTSHTDSWFLRLFLNLCLVLLQMTLGCSVCVLLHHTLASPSSSFPLLSPSPASHLLTYLFECCKICIPSLHRNLYQRQTQEAISTPAPIKFLPLNLHPHRYLS